MGSKTSKMYQCTCTEYDKDLITCKAKEHKCVCHKLSHKLKNQAKKILSPNSKVLCRANHQH